MEKERTQRINSYEEFLSTFEGVSFGGKMDEILHYLSTQEKTPVAKSEVLIALMEDFGMIKKESLKSVLLAIGTGYLTVELGIWPIVLLVESGLWMISLFNRKERAFEQLETLDQQIEMVRKKCEWYFSENMTSEDTEKFIACFYILGPLICQIKEKLIEFMKKFGEEKRINFLKIKYNVHYQKELKRNEQKHQEKKEEENQESIAN